MDTQSISIPLLERHAELPDRDEALIQFRNGLRERLDRLAQESAGAPFASRAASSDEPIVEAFPAISSAAIMSDESLLDDFGDDATDQNGDEMDAGGDLALEFGSGSDDVLSDDD